MSRDHTILFHRGNFVCKNLLSQTKNPATLEDAGNGDNCFKWKCVKWTIFWLSKATKPAKSRCHVKGVPRQVYTCEWALTLIYHQLQVHILIDHDILVFYNSNHGVIPGVLVEICRFYSLDVVRDMYTFLWFGIYFIFFYGQ